MLTAANTYSGPTAVNAGKLYIDGSQRHGAVTVANGATLGGNGSLASGTVTVEDAGSIEAGYGGSGSLTLAGLTFSNNGTINITNIGNYAPASRPST